MLTITDGGSLTHALGSSLDPLMKQLLIQRRDQLGSIENQARFIVPRCTDSVHDLEQELGFPIIGAPESVFGPEWVADHGTFYEAVWILSDDGYAHAALIEKQSGIDPRLLELCEEYAGEQLTA